MAPLQYLDTARLGRMTPAARDAQLDFVRLSAEEPSSLYFEQFLRDGFCAWPVSYQNRFSGLRTWTGVTGLKQSLQQLTQAPRDWQVLLANRSLTLIGLAAKCLFRTCRHLLTTDLSWPTYQQAVEYQAARAHNRVTSISLRDGILREQWSAGDIVASLTDAYARYRCDGLFLPAVDHLGVRLPIPEIVERIRRAHELRFCLVDAAQAFCHVPLGDCLVHADFVVVGGHKWMGAALPIGIGVFGQTRSREVIEHRLNELGRRQALADPLLQFTEQLAAGNLNGHSETANLTSLFACAGAAADRLMVPSFPENGEPLSMDELLPTLRAPSPDWRALLPAKELRTQVLLLESQNPATRQQSSDAIRRTWLEAGSVITAYREALVRVSLPRQELVASS